MQKRRVHRQYSKPKYLELKIPLQGHNVKPHDHIWYLEPNRLRDHPYITSPHFPSIFDPSPHPLFVEIGCKRTFHGKQSLM